MGMDMGTDKDTDICTDIDVDVDLDVDVAQCMYIDIDMYIWVPCFMVFFTILHGY